MTIKTAMETNDMTRGAERFATALRLALSCLALAVLLQLLLYLRPAPQGGPFLAEWPRYFWLALYYEMLGVWLVSTPFFLLWLLRFRRETGARWAGIVAAIQAGLLTLYLLFSAVDHEVMRFLGVRLNPSFVWAYGRPEMLSDSLFRDVLRTDQGGPYLSLLLVVAVPLLYLALAWRLLRLREKRVLPIWPALILALLPLLAPANGWRMASSQFRLRKVEPIVLAFATDIAAGYEEFNEPPDLADLAAAHQRAWFARSTDPNWRFPDPERPYLRVSTAPPPPPERPGTSSISNSKPCAAPIPASSAPTAAARRRLISTASPAPLMPPPGPARSASGCRASTACSPPTARSCRPRAAT